MNKKRAPLTRSEIMARIRAKDTKPEMEVRRALHRTGARFRLHAGDLPGRPDVVNRAKRWAVQVHGCFWHAHAGCRHSGAPKTNAEAWRAKFAANRARDARSEAALAALGYRVLMIWECDLKRTPPDILQARLALHAM